MTELRQIFPTRDAKVKAQWIALLTANDLTPDEQVTACYGIFSDDELVATGAYDQDIIKLLAIAPDYRGGAVMNELISAIMADMAQQGILHYFVYTKPSSAASFLHLGFKVIAQTEDIVFLEQGIQNFDRFIMKTKQAMTLPGPYTAIVMNANPFTLGHRYLIEQAVATGQPVVVFVVAEDRSLFSFQERLALVKAGVTDLPNVTVVSTDHYLVSNATFPTYFLKNQAPDATTKQQALLDAMVFLRISAVLMINQRFVGEEPLSPTTEIYNEAMATAFQQKIKLTIVPRVTEAAKVISATRVRTAIKDNQIITLSAWVPESTATFIKQHLAELQARL